MSAALDAVDDALQFLNERYFVRSKTPLELVSQLKELPQKSFLPIADDSHFTLQNLPFGVFIPNSQPSVRENQRIGVAIGNNILNLYQCTKQGYFEGSKLLSNGECFLQPTLNRFMGLEKEAWVEARHLITLLLSNDSLNPLRLDTNIQSNVLIAQSDVTMVLPSDIGSFTDFFSCKHHAQNCGALKEQWYHMPQGYHSRASSVVVSGTDIRRPWGQVVDAVRNCTFFRKVENLDFELELGWFYGGSGNPLGSAIPLAQASDHIFGVVLLNDWSARDVQDWEMKPLGPFCSKNFATTISPWIVTTLALEPFQIPVVSEEKESESHVKVHIQEPKVLPYLSRVPTHIYDIKLTASIETANMRLGRLPQSATISRTNAKHLYWSFEQQLTHHTVTGCNFSPGDLCGSGTVSGMYTGTLGCLVEITEFGRNPLILGDKYEERKFLANGDKVVLSGEAVTKDGKHKVGFGSCEGVILEAFPQKFWDFHVPSTSQ